MKTILHFFYLWDGKNKRNHISCDCFHSKLTHLYHLCCFIFVLLYFHCHSSNTGVTTGRSTFIFFWSCRANTGPWRTKRLKEESISHVSKARCSRSLTSCNFVSDWLDACSISVMILEQSDKLEHKNSKQVQSLHRELQK